MKTQRYLLLLSMICLSFLLIKCGKDGSVGPAGNTGDKGAAGATGAVGPAGPAGANGTAGSVIYSGNTTPAVSKGVIGDFYLDTSTGLLYGPKTANGWGVGFSLKGANGATGATGASGAAGSTTLSGAGLPAASLGKTGDYYLDKTNYLLYGPKTVSGWGIPINLQGPAGPQGPAGNANVKVDTFTVKTADWIYGGNYMFSTGGGVTSYYVTKYFDRNNSLITANLLISGLVLVYFQSNPDHNNAQWEPFPFSSTVAGNGYNQNFVYETFVGKVRLHFYLTKDSIKPPSLSTYDIQSLQYKIIVVSGTLLGSIHQNHINVNNYNEVSRFLGIQ
jgi:hypothetical protein